MPWSLAAVKQSIKHSCPPFCMHMCSGQMIKPSSSQATTHALLHYFKMLLCEVNKQPNHKAAMSPIKQLTRPFVPGREGLVAGDGWCCLCTISMPRTRRCIGCVCLPIYQSHGSQHISVRCGILQDMCHTPLALMLKSCLHCCYMIMIGVIH